MMDLQNIYAMLAMGFLTSLGHCVGMCGGFIMAYSVNLNKSPDRRQYILPHILYHSVRILTYSIIGIVFGLLGQTTKSILTVFHLQDALFILAGVIMILLGLELLGIFPALRLDKLRIMNKYQGIVRRTIQKVNTKNIFFLGFILGFIPCGPVYIAGAVAASSGSVLTGAVTMVAFGLGTFPILGLFGLSTNLISIRFRQIIIKVTAVIVIIFGALTIYKGIQKWNQTPEQHLNCCESETELTE